MKPVVVVIDMQNDFFEQKERLLEQKDLLIKNINELTEQARNRGVPIIWVRQVWKADLSDSPKHIKNSGKGIVIEGTKGSELLKGLLKLSGDCEIIKTRYSGFFGTKLNELLEDLKIDTLIIGGINTHACVRMTAIDAWQRDYDVIIAKDCVGSYDDEHHKVTMRYFEPVITKIKTNDKIRELLKN
jgi:nicotinamidase-related amidase